MEGPLGEYSLVETLYENGTFIVYKAVNADRTSVLIKYPKDSLAAQRACEICTHERSILKIFKSSSIAKVISLEEAGDRPFLVFEDNGSIPITTFSKKIGRGSEPFLRVIIDIVRVLADIHGARIIHASIRPTSIMIDPVSGKFTFGDFEYASKVPYSFRFLSTRSAIGGSAVYISPEQTGMMNRSVDERTDFYSLGVVLYELLTRRAMFAACDPIDLVRAHLTEYPADPYRVDRNIPHALSDIVMKLLAKKPEDRYQSCGGIIRDLEHCMGLVVQNRQSETFPLGEDDLGNQFYVPEKLYGRNTHSESMRNLFMQASGAGVKPKLVFISGPPGIGKSSLIFEFRNSMMGHNGFIISGKYDQFRRSVPYSAVITAFRNLVDFVLSDRRVSLAAWRSRIIERLGRNAGVVKEIVATLERITGPVAPPPELSPAETEVRFAYVFQNFIQLFAEEARPLVLVLEDLQWADSSSLRLIETLLKNPELTNFLFIGSYREEDIDDAHPLSHFFNDINAGILECMHVRLNPLSLDDVSEMLSDMLHTRPADARSLAEMMLTHTAGNPFFVMEYIKSLGLGKLFGSLVTDSVVGFVAGKILLLPGETREVLRVAACAGITIFFDTLALVCGKTEDELIDVLRPAIDEGLVIKLEMGAMFAHDRVREAVYGTLDERERNDNHFRLGKALLDITPDDMIEDRIFPIVHQLNMARTSETDRERMIRLARFNFLAGLKSKHSAAYESALEFFSIANELLPDDAWSVVFDLKLSLAIERCEVGYLTSKLDLAEASFREVLENARDRLDKVRVYRAQIPLNTAIGKAGDAMEQGRTACLLLGIKCPKRVTPLHVAFQLVKGLINIKRRKIGTLVGLPEIIDPIPLAVNELLMNMTLPAYISAPEAVPYIMLKMFNFSIRHGNSPFSAYAYAGFSLILACVLGDIEAGYELGKYAYELAQNNSLGLVRCKVDFIFGNLVNHWKKPLRDDIPYLDQGAIAGFESGDITFASFCINHRLAHALFCGDRIDSVRLLGRHLLGMIMRFKRIDSIQAFFLFYQCVINLGQDDPGIAFKLCGSYFDEDRVRAEWVSAKNNTDLGFYHVIKQMFSYLERDYDASLRHSQECRRFHGNMLGMLYVRESYYYHALAVLAADSRADRITLKKRRAEAVKIRNMLLKWERACPGNCLHKRLFIDAELASASGSGRHILALYEQAASAAATNLYINEQAMILERAAIHCERNGLFREFESYIARAYEAYFRWGAQGKCTTMRNTYPDLFETLASIF